MVAKFHISKTKRFFIWLSCFIFGHRSYLVRRYKYGEVDLFKCELCFKKFFVSAGGFFEGASVPWSQEDQDYWDRLEQSFGKLLENEKTSS